MGVTGAKPVEVNSRLVDKAGNVTFDGKVGPLPLKLGTKNFGLPDVAN